MKKIHNTKQSKARYLALGIACITAVICANNFLGFDTLALHLQKKADLLLSRNTSAYAVKSSSSVFKSVATKSAPKGKGQEISTADFQVIDIFEEDIQAEQVIKVISFKPKSTASIQQLSLEILLLNIPENVSQRSPPVHA